MKAQSARAARASERRNRRDRRSESSEFRRGGSQIQPGPVSSQLAKCSAGLRDARGIGGRRVFVARRFCVQLGGGGDDAISETARGANRRSGERLAKRARLLEQCSRF